MEVKASPEHPSRAQQASDRRSQIVETALDLFARQGFDATSTKQIARAAGVAEGLIFHYFPTKAALLSSVLETPHVFIGEFRELLAGAGDTPVAALLDTLAARFLATFRREKAITLVMAMTAQANPHVASALYSVIDEAAERLAGYLAGRVAAGELRADLPAEPAARMIWFALFAFFLKNHDLPDGEWTRLAETFRTGMLSVWLDGARRPAAPAPGRWTMDDGRWTMDDGR